MLYWSCFFGRLNRHILFLCEVIFYAFTVLPPGGTQTGPAPQTPQRSGLPRAMTALYTGLLLVWISSFSWQRLRRTLRLYPDSLLADFHCAGRRLRALLHGDPPGERSEYLTLFDGFSFAGRLIA